MGNNGCDDEKCRRYQFIGLSKFLEFWRSCTLLNFFSGPRVPLGGTIFRQCILGGGAASSAHLDLKGGASELEWDFN